MQDFNQLFSFAMRMPRQRLAQELVKPTGVIPPAIAMAALQKMNSVNAAPAQGPTVAQQMAQGATGEMQAFAGGGIVKLSGGGNDWWQKLGPSYRGEYPTRRTEPFPPEFSVADWLRSEELRRRGLDREMSHQPPGFTQVDPSVRMPKLEPAAAAEQPSEAAGERTEKPASEGNTKSGERGVAGIEDYFKRISGLVPDRYAGYEAGLGALNKELARQRANVVPTALMAAGVNMIGRRTPYATEAMGEGARAGLGAFVTGQDAQRKAQMETLGLEGKVAGDRNTQDVNLVRSAMEDRRTDEFAESRRQSGDLARENATEVRMMAAVTQAQDKALKLAQDAVSKSPGFLTMTEEQRSLAIAREFQTQWRLFLLTRPDINAYLEQRGGGGGGANVRAVPWASGGAPAQPGK